MAMTNRKINARRRKNASNPAKAEKSWVNNDTSQPGNMPAESFLKMAPSETGAIRGNYPDSIAQSMEQINSTQRKLNKNKNSDHGL